jgi:hypothetical protein
VVNSVIHQLPQDWGTRERQARKEISESFPIGRPMLPLTKSQSDIYSCGRGQMAGLNAFPPGRGVRDRQPGPEVKIIGRMCDMDAQEGKGPQKSPEDSSIDGQSEAELEYDAGESPAPVAPHPHWTAFAAAYPDHPALKCDTIYALPEPLIEVISDRIPRFFTPDERRFECDLARSAGAGFFLKRPFRFPLLPGLVLDENEKAELDRLHRRQREAHDGIQEVLDEHMEEHGRSDRQIIEFWATKKQMERKAEVHKWGYAGWLVTHPEFCRARDEFRQRWEPTIRELGTFPGLPISVLGETPTQPVQRHRDFWMGYQHFLRLWGLDRLVTWELPVPMRPELTGPSFYDLSTVGEAGVLLFIPWYLLRGKDIKLHDVAQQKVVLAAPTHLEEWLEGRPKYFGQSRYAIMLELYIYIELCLRARYGGRLSGHIDKLEYTLSHFMSTDQRIRRPGSCEKDSLSKIRKAMAKRLERCARDSAQ